jgi:hypothetical protein
MGNKYRTSEEGGRSEATATLAVFLGEHGEDDEISQAMTLFEKGKAYRVTSKVVYRWCTLLEIDGIPGEWNPGLFRVNLVHVPTRKEFGYRRSTRRRILLNWIKRIFCCRM